MVARAAKKVRSEDAPRSEKVGALVAADYNPRVMDPYEREKLKRSIREFGFVEPVVARRSDKLIIGGHQRLSAFRSMLEDDGLSAAQIEEREVPVVWVDVDDQRAKVLNLALNRIVGGWDFAKLAVVFDELGHDWSDDLHGLAGFDARELDDVMEFASESLDSDDRSEKIRVGAADVPRSSPSVVCPHCGGEVVLGAS